MRALILSLVIVAASVSYVYAVESSVETKSSAESESAMNYCPVCGPEEEMEELSFSYKFNGKKYRFCSLDCMKAFKENPEKFVTMDTDAVMTK